MRATTSPTDFSILVIEDDPGIAELERREINKLGHRCEVVETMHDAITALSRETYDFLVLDFILPDGDAREFLDLLERRLPKVPPFIVTTGMGDERVAVQMMKRGAVDYILKDHSFLELLGPAIDRALKNLESERTLAVARGKLAEIERRFLVVSENASDVIFLLDPYRRRLTYASTSIARMLKIKDFDPDGFQMTRWFSRADFRTLSRSIAMKIREARLYAAPDKPELHRVDVLSSDGTVVRSEISLSAVEGKDGSFEILGIVRDIGKRLEVEEALRHSLDEKEVLLREVHHRVKNNLQIVSSLLSLQMMANPDPTLGRELSKSQGRIRAMAIIHEQLCESDDVTAISTKYYIEKLASSMVEFADRPVEMRFEVDDFFLDLAEAVPCGLILNELIMNALRHGCPRDGSEVLIRFQGDGPRRTIAVTDRGPGLPAGVDPERSKSLGFTLVNTLTYQLGGSLAWRSGDGCQVSVSWGGKTA